MIVTEEKMRPLCSFSVTWLGQAFIIPTYRTRTSLQFSSARSCSSRVASEVCCVHKACDDGMREFSLDGTKITTLVHSTWKQVVNIGDIVVDATCGNGNDTAVLAKLVCGKSNQGTVHGFDSQKVAVEKTSSFLNKELTVNQRECVRLYHMCHSKLGEVIKQENSVSVVAFNLGYLPRGDKLLTTGSKTTVEALKCAISLVRLGGIITIVSYVGHPGGREEYEAVREFAAKLPTESWVCSQQEWLNRPLCPRLLVLLKKEC
eukprot:c36524_g1_i1 orf=626-1408(-)